MVNKRSKLETIFEILDTQSDEKTIADIVRCIFYKNCNKAVFITKDLFSRIDTDGVIKTIVECVRNMSKTKSIITIETMDADFNNFSKEQIKSSIEQSIGTTGLKIQIKPENKKLPITKK